MPWLPGARELLLRRPHARGIGEEVEGGERHGLGGGEEARLRQRLHRGRLELSRVDGGAERRDADHGLDGGDDLAHVPHVGGAEAVADGRPLAEPHRRHVGGEEVQQGLIPLQRLVDIVGLLGGGERAPGGLRRALRAGGHALVEVPHDVDAGSADVEDGGGILRDDVRGGPAVGDDPVDPAVRPYLLAQHGHCVEHCDTRIQRVDPFPRVRGSMRGLAVELEGAAYDPEEVLVEDRPVEAVDHHGAVHALEHAPRDEPVLPAAALLGGRADHLDSTLRQHGLGQREPGARARAGGRDHVVAAGMADAGQGVVLAHDGDGGSLAGVDGRAEGGLHTGHALLDLEALVAEELGEPAHRLFLLIAQLGMVMDAAGEGLELVTETVDGLDDGVLGGAHGASRMSRGTGRRRGRREAGRAPPRPSRRRGHRRRRDRGSARSSIDRPPTRSRSRR